MAPNVKVKPERVYALSPEPPDVAMGALPRTDEVDDLAGRYSLAHGAAASIACLWHLSSKLLNEFGSANGTDLRPMVQLLYQALRTHGAGVGVSENAILAALRDLQRAGETAAYLHALPD